MRYLVTGGAGFIGSHVVHALCERGDEVVVLDDLNDFYAPDIKKGNLASLCAQAVFVAGDIRDRAAVDAVFENHALDGVIHLAARAGVRPSLENPELYLDTNVKGTWFLLEAARRSGVKDFIFASSSSVYGVNRKVPFAEDDLIQSTISPYAASKIAGEQLCSNYAHLYGMRCICLRFFTVYGPGQRPDLAIHKFTRLIDEERPIPLFGDGSTERDYTFVDDIVQGVLAAIDYRDKNFDIFNLGESQTTTLLELVRTIEQALGKQAIIDWQPEQPGDVPRTFADISKSRALLGYDPQVKIADGIPKFVAWYRARRQAADLARPAPSA